MTSFKEAFEQEMKKARDAKNAKNIREGRSTFNVVEPPVAVPPPQYKPVEQLVRTYHIGGMGGTPQKKFEKDAAKLACEGWRVQSTGFQSFTLSLTVTYTRP